MVLVKGVSFIIYRYNYLKNKMSKVLFLFVLIFSLNVNAQILFSNSHCFGNCTTCDPLDYSHCQGSTPCQWGFDDHLGNGQCTKNPSTQIISTELGQRVNQSVRLVASGWSFTAKQSLCQYSSPSGIRNIDVLGLYSGVEMLEKTFTVDPRGEIFDLSFNLLRGQWLPFNDFLIVDISSNNKNIQTLEISLDMRVKMDSQSSQITCEGQKVMSQKYNIKIINNQRIKGNLTVIFTSFLFNAVWALSNVRLIQACDGYSMFNAKSQECDLCDSDSFVVKQNQASWCEKCPLLCKSCESAVKCLTCVTGAVVEANGLCGFGDNFKTQVVPWLSPQTFCDGSQLIKGSIITPITLEPLKNDNSELYDQIQIGFILYYSPLNWQSSKDSILLKVNQVEVMRIKTSSLTNKATTHCSLFSNDMSKIEIFSDKIVHSDNLVNLEFEVMGSIANQIGISDVRVKSIKKAKVVVPEPIVPPKNLTVTPVKEPVPNITQNNSLPVNNNTNNVTTPVNPPVTPTTTPIPSIPATPTDPVTSSNQTTPTNTTSNHISSAVPVSPTQPTQQSAPQIAFLPALSNKKPGIQVYILGQSQNTQNYYTASIDVLSPDKYSIDSYFMKEGRLHMFILVNQSFTEGTVSIYRHSTARLLQSSSNVLVGSFKVQRFDSLTQSEVNGINSFAKLFTVAAWIGVIMIILSVMSGYGIVFEEYVLALQILFLHVYIASDYIPISFRDVIGGLNIIQNLNFFHPTMADSIEHQWMGNVIQNGPVRFYLFNTDINFLRDFYPIIIINIIYLIWFVGIFVVRHFVNRNILDEEKGVIHKFLDRTGGRIVNTMDQIWRYQLLATLWACFVQFHNLAYPDGSDRNQAINSVICIFAFICTLAWPIFVAFYTRKQYYQCQYSQFLYYFEDIYFFKIPQYQLPSSHHRMGYPLLRAAKIFFIALTICYFGTMANLALTILILLHIFDLIYIRIEDIYNEKIYFLTKVIQNSIFILVDLVLLILLNFSSLADSGSYLYMGFILAGISFMIIVNALLRSLYLGFKKYNIEAEVVEDWIADEKKAKTQRVV